MSGAWIGTSGWDYDDWQGNFYPDHLPKHRRLEFACRALNSIEHNGTFYGMARPSTYRKWYDQARPTVCYAIKAPRFITHVKRLKNIHAPLANFFASGVLELKERLGPILWQLPGSVHYDKGTLESFLALLPKDFHQAATLGRGHDDKLKSEPALRVVHNHRIRHALEIRHESFLCDDCIYQLKRHNVALVASDGAGHWPYVEQITAGFVYVRLHGATNLYQSNYDEQALDRWGQRIGIWQHGGEPRGAARCSNVPPPKRKARDVYVYFDNTYQGRAPANAQSLAVRLR